ncbi:MAG: MarC family NAAT transporter [Chlorobiales bacterium]|nr:MarC family NAAT transporter [Chlorobiales bacterium]
MLQDWLVLIGGTFAALLPITNPFSVAPVFVSITEGMAESRRDQQARMAIVYTCCILVGALLVGSVVLNFFGISIPALRIAGGLVVARVGFSMLDPDPGENLPDASKQEARNAKDIAFTPLAMPLLSGPGSIAVTISMATHVHRPVEYFAVAIGILLVAFSAWLVLRSSMEVVKFLGQTGMTALTRLMGFLLVCIGIQFIALGLFEGVTSDAVVDTLLKAYQSTGNP